MKRSRKKIVLIGTLPPTIGGISSYVYNLWERLLIDKHDVVVFDVVYKDCFNQAAFDASNPFKLLIGFLLHYFKGYRIFHFNTSQKAIPLLVLFPFSFLPGIRFICSVHSGDYHNWLFKDKLRTILFKFVFSTLDQLVFMNKHQAEVMREKLNLTNINSVSSFIVIDPKWYDKTEEYALKSPIKISTMGLWQNYYRYEDVIEVCQLISDTKGLEFQIDVIVGTSNPDKEYKAKFIKAIEKFKNSGIDIKIIEDKGDILNYLSTRDVFIRSSEIDSYGLCVAEALLAGTHAIATNVCQRSANSILYSSGNIHELKDQLLCVLNNLRTKKIRQCLLPYTEDSYENILQIYYA